jgi:YHS domain-containing protein
MLPRGTLVLAQRKPAANHLIVETPESKLVGSNSTREELMSTDPVCGMEVHESTAPAMTQHNAVTYYFCSHKCLGAFQDAPAKYVETAA